MRVLVSGAEAKDLSDVVDVLKANQVEFEYSENGDTILVPEDKRAAMRMELAMKDFPAVEMSGFEIFDEGNFESVILCNERIIRVLFKVSCLARSQ